MLLSPLYILASSQDPLSHVVQHKLFTVPVGNGLVVSNHILMLTIAALLLMIGIPAALRRSELIPRGFANFIESICVYLRDEMTLPQLGEHTDRFIKYIWTLFFFILTSNLLGFFPTDSVIYLITGKHHIGGTATANIWVTGSLALISFLVIHISGIAIQGPVAYIKNFVPKVPLLIVPMMIVLELFSALIKPFALAVRLFANMLAGHTVLGSLILIAMASHSYLISGVTLLGCVAFSLMELFVAFLQAYIFTFLTIIFISAAIHPEH